MRRPADNSAARGWLALLVVTLVVLAAVAALGPRELVELPFAGSEARIRTVLGAWTEDQVRGARRAIDADYGLIVLYVGLLASACFWRAAREPAGRDPRGYWRLPAAFATVAALGGACDLVENLLLERTITNFRRGVSLPDARVLQGAAFGKVAGLALVLAYLVSLVPQRLPRPAGGPLFAPATARPPFLREAGLPHPWQPPLDSTRRGVCLAGTGPDADEYARGALEALGECGGLSDVAYVALAGDAAAVARDPMPCPAPAQGGGMPNPGFARPGEPSRQARGSSGVGSTATTAVGIAVNLALVWLLLFCAARPTGWLISSDWLHPELRAREPYVTVERVPTVADVQLTRLPGPANGDGPRLALNVTWNDARARLEGREVRNRTARLPVLVTRGGTIGFDDGRLRVLQQPRIDVDPEDINDVFNAVPGRASIRVSHQPTFVLNGAAQLTPSSDLDLDSLVSGIDLTEAPELAEVAGVTGRPPIDVRPWMVAVPGGLAAAAVVAHAARLLSRADRWPLPLLAPALAGLAAAALALFVIVPWVVQEVPTAWRDLLGALTGSDPGPVPRASSALDWVAAGAAFATLALTASIDARRRASPPTELSRPRRILSRAAAVVGGVVVAGAGGLVFVDLVEIAAANGPFGRLAGFGIGLQPLPDAARFVLAVAVLVGAWRAIDAHANAAGLAAAGPDGLPAPLSALAWSGTAAQLVVCAAARVRSPGAEGADVGAVPITFSAREVGGANVGYVQTAALEDALSPARRTDFSVPALVALAAGSDRAATSRLCCLANLGRARWLPHPQWLRTFIDTERSPSGATDASGGGGREACADHPADAATSDAESGHDSGGPVTISITETEPFPAAGAAPRARAGGERAAGDERAGDKRAGNEQAVDERASGEGAESGTGSEAEGRTDRDDASPGGRGVPGAPAGSGPDADADPPERDGSETAGTAPARPRWTDRPGWPYLLAELAGRAPSTGRYLAATGAGAVEPLGLVELLRRGCTEIVCVRAPGALGNPGDGRRELAVAIARARAELGIDIALDLDADIGSVGAWVGTVRYPATARHDGKEVRGHVVVVGFGGPAHLGWDIVGLTGDQSAHAAPATSSPAANAPATNAPATNARGVNAPASSAGAATVPAGTGGGRRDAGPRHARLAFRIAGQQQTRAALRSVAWRLATERRRS